MADNLQTIQQEVENKITNQGGAGTILASDHQAILLETLKKAGKFAGIYFLAELNNDGATAFFSWENNAMNANDFQVRIGAQSADLDDVEMLLNSLKGNVILHYKDYAGRSAMYKMTSWVKETNNSIDSFVLTLNSFSSNPNYTYQVNETLIAGLTFKANTNKTVPYGELTIYKASGNVNLDEVEAGDTVVGQLQNDVFLTRGVFVAGDPTDVASYNDDSEYFDPNDV